MGASPSLVHSQTRYLPKEPDICWTYQFFPKIWSLLGGRYLVGAASARLSGAMGPRYLALVPTSHKISASSRHQISGRGPRDRYLASPGQGICDCSGRYLASPTPDICRWTRRTDIWSAAERDICPTGPMENHPGYRVPERKPYRCAHPDNLVTAMYSRGGLPVAQLGLRFSTVPVQQPLHQACSGPSLHMGLRPRASICYCHWRTLASPHPLQRSFLWKLPVHN